MFSFSLPVSVFVTLGFLVSSAQGQEPPPFSRQDDASGLKKKLADLEDQVSSLQRQLRELRQQLQPQTTLTVIPVRSVNVKEVAKALKILYRNRAGFEVAGLVEMKCLMIRADEKTKEEIARLIAGLEEVGREGKQANRKKIPEKTDSKLPEKTNQPGQASDKQRSSEKK